MLYCLELLKFWKEFLHTQELPELQVLEALNSQDSLELSVLKVLSIFSLYSFSKQYLLNCYEFHILAKKNQFYLFSPNY